MDHRPTACSLCILAYCNLSYPDFGFEGGTLILIASVLGHCLLFTFDICNLVEFVLHVNIKPSRDLCLIKICDDYFFRNFTSYSTHHFLSADKVSSP